MAVAERTDPATTLRLSHLRKANKVRTYRAALKAELTEGTLLLSEALHSRSKYMRTMRLQELLMATPKVGRSKAIRALRACWLSSSSTVAGTTPKAKENLLSWLAEYSPSINTGFEGAK